MPDSQKNGSTNMQETKWKHRWSITCIVRILPRQQHIMVEMKSHEETEHLCDDGKRKADFFTLNVVFNRGAKSNQPTWSP